MPGSDRKDLAVQALARSTTISNLSDRHGVSRKFVYQQTHKARVALDHAFSSAADDDVLFSHQDMAAPGDRCVGADVPRSYLGIIEFMRDLLGVPISIRYHSTCFSRPRGRRA